MFLDYYQLSEQPFGAVLNPAQVYASHAHREALESSTSSILADRGSFALTAPSGMGKTILLSQLFENIQASGRATFLFQSRCDSLQILQFLLNKLGVDSTNMDSAAMLRKLNAIWFAEMLAGKRFVLLFDDSQHLPESVLNTLRQLSKLETSNSKFLQLVFFGQPSFLKKLQDENFAPLAKRFIHIFHLPPLSPMETAGYIRHRLFTAGYRGKLLFDPEAMAAVAELSGGIPQNINRICSRALFEAYARGLQAVTSDIVEKAGRNLGTPSSVVEPNTAEPAVKSPSTRVTGTRTRRAPSQLTYFIPKSFGLPSSSLWTGAVLGVLLSAGLALPHAMHRGVTQIAHGTQTSAAASPQSASTSPILSTLDRPAIAGAQSATASITPSTSGADTREPQSTQISSESYKDTAGQLSLTRELGLKINRIVIDPGHGGFDTGAKGPHGLLEKDLCLDVALRLGQMIEANIPGAEVVFTRKDDTYVPLEERTAIANGADADLFISIHANSSDSAQVRGVETYYLSLATSSEAKQLAIRENALTQSSLHDLPDLVKKITNNEKIAESKLLAAEIQDILSQRLQLVSGREKNRGVKHAPFIVLTGANMPAVLSEISFVSNASDETLLLESGQRQRIADGLYRGISSYLDGLHTTPQYRQKLFTENRADPSSGFARSVAEAGRRPL